jgi:hypothetical protein
MNREEIIMIIKGCSVHVQEEIKQPREHMEVYIWVHNEVLSPCLFHTH